MAFKRRTLRRTSPKARELLKLCNQLESVRRKLIRIASDLQDLEDFEAIARADAQRIEVDHDET
jgi:hypothetical protein